MHTVMSVQTPNAVLRNIVDRGNRIDRIASYFSAVMTFGWLELVVRYFVKPVGVFVVAEGFKLHSVWFLGFGHVRPCSTDN